MNQAERNQKAPQYILMDGVEQTAAHGKIKGYLGKKRKQQQPAGVLFQISGVEISFYN